MLTLSDISKSYGGRVLFAEASLQVNRQDRIGLVGPNGAGKTTLFSIILGQESADEGKFTLERGVTMGYLPQESAPVGDETVIELATAITPEIRQACAGSSRPGKPITRSRRCIRKTFMTMFTIVSTNWAVIGSRPRPNKFSRAWVFAKTISTGRRAR